MVQKGHDVVGCVLQAHLEVKPEALNAIARLALERKTGARGLRAILVCSFVTCRLLPLCFPCEWFVAYFFLSPDQGLLAVSLLASYWALTTTRGMGAKARCLLCSVMCQGYSRL